MPKPEFECTLAGDVVMCGTFTKTDEASGRALYTHLHVVAKQPNGVFFEAVQIVGTGPDAVTRAAVMKGRMQTGVRIEAHGGWVGIAGQAVGDPPRLFLHNVEYIRTAYAQTQRTPANVYSILGRLAERVPAVARGLQAAHPATIAQV